ncbi:MAG: outer membrane beta-barrel protein [Cyclobacteriaceae bacterium]|nr:outer membrane beta-barrel protein [Cyclobacteriaceae bacterium]
MATYFTSRVSLVFQFSILCSSFLYAQQSGVLGLRVGLSQSNIDGSFIDYIGNFVPGNVPPYRPTDKQGFEFAALGYYSLGKALELNYGLGFIQKGGTLNNRDLGYTVDPTLNYLYIPIGINFKPIQLERFSVHASVNITTNIQITSEQPYLIDYSETARNNKVILGYSVGGFFRYKLNEKLALQGDVQFVGDFNPFFTASDQNENFEMKTKGQVLSVGLVSAFSSDSFNENRKLSLLFKAGYVVSSLHGSYVEYIRNSSFGDPYTLRDKQGFEVAALASLQIAKPVYLVSGLGFIQKGGGIDDASVYPVDVTLNYLSIPLGVAINPINAGKASLFFTSGLTGNIEVFSEQEFLKGTNPDGLQPEKSNTFILGYSVGGAFRYKLNETVSLQVDASALSDFTPFYERELEGRQYEMKTKGNSFSIGAVYQLK